MAKEWIQINDKDVVHIWKCSECGCEVKIAPSYYNESGTPMCTVCDRDMEYSHTLVNIEKPIKPVRRYSPMSERAYGVVRGTGTPRGAGG